MSTRKNKKYTAGQAKKGSERKAIEPLTKKEGCNVKAVRIFKHRDIGKIANKSVETKTAGECRVSRVVEPSLADLMGARSASPSASSCGGGRQQPRLPSGLRRMRLTNDKCLWLIKRWASLVEAHADVKRDGRAYDPDVLHRDDVAEEGPDQEDELRATAAEDPERHGRDDDCGGCLEDLNGLAECTKDPTLS